jgi:hypothetical protein
MVHSILVYVLFRSQRSPFPDGCYFDPPKSVLTFSSSPSSIKGSADAIGSEVDANNGIVRTFSISYYRSEATGGSLSFGSSSPRSILDQGRARRVLRGVHASLHGKQALFLELEPVSTSSGSRDECEEIYAKSGPNVLFVILRATTSNLGVTGHELAHNLRLLEAQVTGGWHWGDGTHTERQLEVLILPTRIALR